MFTGESLNGSGYQAIMLLPISNTVGNVKRNAGSSVCGADFSFSVKGSPELHTIDIISSRCEL